MTVANVRKLALAIIAIAGLTTCVSNASAQGGWINPEIYNSGRQLTDVRYDPFTGQIIVRTDQTKVRESVLDPNRGQIDPGSYRNVNRYETDAQGVRWHVTGTQWTSNGVPHGNLSRRRIVNGGGSVVEDRNETVIFSAQTGGKSNNASTQNSRTNHTRQRSNKLPVTNGAKSNLRQYSPF